jgi:uncharacterized protein (TIGR02145 family)
MKKLFYFGSFPGLLLIFAMFCGSCDVLEKRSPPWADFTISPDSGTTFTDFTFTVTYLHDDITPESELRIRWDLDGDSVWETEFSTERTITRRFKTPGNQVAFCEVRDGDYMSCLIAKPLPVKVDYFDLTAIPDNRNPYNRNTYGLVRIGEQVWMKANMDFFIDGFCSAYENSYTNRKGNGLLYSWEGAGTACIKGFRLPTDEEWKTLEEFLGMDAGELDFIGDRKSGDVASQLKSTLGWQNTTSTGSSGFAAYGTGYKRPDGTFDRKQLETLFWTSTEENDSVWVRKLQHDKTAGVTRQKMGKNWGLSVRCIRDK